MRQGLFLAMILIGALGASAQPQQTAPANRPAVEATECEGCAELREWWQQAYEQGRLRGTVVEATLPDAFPIRLVTSSWWLLIPEINRKYPSRPMKVEGVVVAPPTVACDLAQTEVTAMVDLTFWAQDSQSGTYTLHIFTMRTPYTWSSETRPDLRFPFRAQGAPTLWSVAGTSIGPLDPTQGNLTDLFFGFMQWLRPEN